MHYTRWRRDGDPGEAEMRRPYRKGICRVKGCKNLSHARGWCKMHYLRWYKHGDPGDAELIKGKLPKGEAAFRHLLSGYKRDAKRRSLTWKLTKQEFRNLTRMNCHYCDQPPSNKSNGHGGKTNGAYIYSGVDRIDSSKGYETENCVPCCGQCNTSKSAMDVNDFLNWVARIYWHQAQSWEVT